MRYEEKEVKLNRSWILDKWYDKTIYIVGYISTILFIAGFIVGFLEG
jgi:hypothetical protein